MGTKVQRARQPQHSLSARSGRKPVGGLTLVSQHQPDGSGQRVSSGLAGRAWHWALANQDEHSALPSGGRLLVLMAVKSVGRLVKCAGMAGAFDAEGARDLRPDSG